MNCFDILLKFSKHLPKFVALLTEHTVLSSPDRLDTSDKKQTRFRCAKLLASVSEAPPAHQAKDVAESLNIEQSVPKC